MERLALSIKEAAQVLGLHQDTIRTMIECGQLSAVRVGTGKGKWIISRNDIDALLGAKTWMRKLSGRPAIALGAFLVRQRQVLASKIGAGIPAEDAFNLSRWNRELETELVSAGLSPKKAGRIATKINEGIFARLRDGQSVTNAFAPLL